MQGGSVVVSTASFNANLSNSRLAAAPYNSGLDDWLMSMGFTIKNEMVLDPQNASLPIPVPRRVGPVSVNEIVMMPYPHFPDIRREGLNAGHPVTAGLNQLTFNWASPVILDADKHTEREVVEFVKSSSNSWASDDVNVMPDYQMYPQNGFVPGVARNEYILAATSKGRFESYFKDKESPLLPENSDGEEEDNEKTGDASALGESNVYGSVIQSSSDSACLVVIGSNNFAEDMVLSIASQGMGYEYTGPVDFLQNLVDWSLDDSGLLSIRSRAQLARTLEPMKDSQRRSWEYGNYAAALAGLIIVWMIRMILKRRKRAQYEQILAEI
jgi:ABC-2 type transport system permease protein